MELDVLDALDVEELDEAAGFASEDDADDEEADGEADFDDEAGELELDEPRLSFR